MSGDDIFHVKDLRQLIDSIVTTSSVNPTIWFRLVPIKFISVIWRVCIDCIPTATALIKQGMHMSNVSHHLCNNEIDESNHLLVGCPFVIEVMGVDLELV